MDERLRKVELEFAASAQQLRDHLETDGKTHNEIKESLRTIDGKLDLVVEKMATKEGEDRAGKKTLLQVAGVVSFLVSTIIGVVAILVS